MYVRDSGDGSGHASGHGSGRFRTRDPTVPDKKATVPDMVAGTVSGLLRPIIGSPE